MENYKISGTKETPNWAKEIMAALPELPASFPLPDLYVHDCGVDIKIIDVLKIGIDEEDGELKVFIFNSPKNDQFRKVNWTVDKIVQLIKDEIGTELLLQFHQNGWPMPPAEPDKLLQDFLNLFFQKGGKHTNTLIDVFNLAESEGVNPRTLSEEKKWIEVVDQFTP